MTDRVRVVVADDHPLFRGGVIRTLEEHGGFEVLAGVGSAEEAVAEAERHLPDVALLDVSMPGSGLAAAAAIGRSFPSVAVVMLTVSENDDDLMAALKAGARGYVLKGVESAELVRVLLAVAGGASHVSPALAARVLTAMQSRDVRTDAADELSQREENILRLVATGLSNKEIARELDLQEKTIKHYMTNILQKLRVRNRVEAALRARDMGI